MTSTSKAYYRGALAAMRFIEAQRPTGRRFGSEADARWNNFRGDLATADRIDLLIRDADAQWPGAFAARRVFALRAVAEDEPFGSTWEPLDTVDAEDIWREEVAGAAPKDVATALAAVGARWEIKLKAFDAGAIAAADKLVVAGPSAIAAVAAAFSRGKDLDWADQVVVVATPPGHRQLAAVAAALLNNARPTAFAADGEKPGRRAVISDDADPEDARRAREIGKRA